MRVNCAVYGHDANPAHDCRACRSEWLETGTWPHGTQHHDARHAPTSPDARQRAAGERDEEMDR